MHAQEKGGKPKRRKNRMISRYMLYRKLKNKTKQKKQKGKFQLDRIRQIGFNEI